MNVSSIVVRTGNGHLKAVIDQINSLDGCEVHFSDASGKIVVTIEGETIHEQTEKLKLIQDIPFVISASLSFSYCEEELSHALSDIKGPVPPHLPD